jgi:hypothetical protein
MFASVISSHLISSARENSAAAAATNANANAAAGRIKRQQAEFKQRQVQLQIAHQNSRLQQRLDEKDHKSHNPNICPEDLPNARSNPRSRNFTGQANYNIQAALDNYYERGDETIPRVIISDNIIAPVEISVMSLLSELSYDKTLSAEIKQRTGSRGVCSICISDFELKDKLVLTGCRHYFHWKCAEPWFIKSDCCAYCRFNCRTNQAAIQENNKTPTNQQENNDDFEI